MFRPARHETIERVGGPGDDEYRERGAELFVDDQQNERGDQHDPQNRELIRQREVAHDSGPSTPLAVLNYAEGRESPASARRRITVSTASMPDTGRVVWNRCPSRSGTTPLETAIDTAG